MKPILTVLVCVSVVQELDAVKRSENGARNAIRWLEREFKEGKFVARSTHPPNNTFCTTMLFCWPKRKLHVHTSCDLTDKPFFCCIE